MLTALDDSLKTVKMASEIRKFSVFDKSSRITCIVKQAKIYAPVFSVFIGFPYKIHVVVKTATQKGLL